MTGLVSVIQQPPLPFIPLNVSDVLLTLHRPDNIELWDPHDTLAAFWEISNQVSCTSPSDIHVCILQWNLHMSSLGWGQWLLQRWPFIDVLLNK